MQSRQKCLFSNGQLYSVFIQHVTKCRKRSASDICDTQGRVRQIKNNTVYLSQTELLPELSVTLWKITI